MRRFLSAAIVCLAIPAAVYGVTIDPKFSIDPASPAINGDITPDDVLRTGPTVLTQGRDLGLQDNFIAGSYDNLDALSYGKDPITQPWYFTTPETKRNSVYFSVDRVSVGLPGSAVYKDAQPGVESAAGNVYRAFPPTGSNSLYIKGQTLGLTPGFFGDDLDAMELDTLPQFPVYFSIDALSATNGFGSGTSAADILVSSGNGTFSVFMDHTGMGLLAFDDIDALALDIANNRALFSLSQFSDHVLFGSASAADIYYTEFDGQYWLWASAGEIGLHADDNVDGLDTVVPEPSTLLLLFFGITVFLGSYCMKIKSDT